MISGRKRKFHYRFDPPQRLQPGQPFRPGAERRHERGSSASQGRALGRERQRRPRPPRRGVGTHADVHVRAPRWRGSMSEGLQAPRRDARAAAGAPRRRYPTPPSRRSLRGLSALRRQPGCTDLRGHAERSAASAAGVALRPFFRLRFSGPLSAYAPGFPCRGPRSGQRTRAPWRGTVAFRSGRGFGAGLLKER